MQKKCLVLGGDGFLGSHLVDDLVARGFAVRVFDIFPQGRSKNLKHLQGRVEFFHGNFLNKNDVERALVDIDYVFHFISLSTPVSTSTNPYQEEETNLSGTLQLLELCVKYKIKKVIYPSSGGAIYGNIGDGLANELTPPNPLSPYAVTKLAIENHLNFYQQMQRLNIVIYRIANPYGERQNPEGTQGVVAIFFKKIFCGESVTLYGNSVRDYIYVKDVTVFIAHNFDKKHTYSTYNLGSGRGVSLFELLRLLAKVTKVQPKIKRYLKRSFDVERIVLDCTRAKKEFGFDPKMNLEKGLAQTYTVLFKKHSIQLSSNFFRFPFFKFIFFKYSRWSRIAQLRNIKI